MEHWLPGIGSDGGDSGPRWRSGATGVRGIWRNRVATSEGGQGDGAIHEHSFGKTTAMLDLNLFLFIMGRISKDEHCT